MTPLLCLCAQVGEQLSCRGLLRFTGRHFLTLASAGGGGAPATSAFLRARLPGLLLLWPHCKPENWLECRCKGEPAQRRKAQGRTGGGMATCVPARLHWPVMVETPPDAPISSHCLLLLFLPCSKIVWQPETPNGVLPECVPLAQLPLPAQQTRGTAAPWEEAEAEAGEAGEDEASAMQAAARAAAAAQEVAEEEEGAEPSSPVEARDPWAQVCRHQGGGLCGPAAVYWDLATSSEQLTLPALAPPLQVQQPRQDWRWLPAVGTCYPSAAVK